MLTRKKNVALIVCLVGGAGGTVGAFAPWTSTMVAPGLFSYDANCEISSTGEAQRQALVELNTVPKADQDVAVPLNGDKDLAADGATYDRTFPAFLTEISSADASAIGLGCNDWHGSAAVKIKTRVRVVASQPTIEVDIWSTSQPGEHFQAHAEMGGSPPTFGAVDSVARYKIESTDKLEILLPFTVSGSATKIKVLQNKITRTQTLDSENCAGSVCRTTVDWWIFEEGETNCVASSTQLVHRSLTQTGDGNTGDGTFTITLPVSEDPYEYVLKVLYGTANALGTGVGCGGNNTLTSTIADHYELELKAL